MRPALTRLLKRPSALSIIDTLAASPIGIEQLDSRYTRLRCYSQCPKKLHLTDDSGCDSSKAHQTRPLWQSKAKKKPYSFSVYDIEPSHDHNPPEPSLDANQLALSDAADGSIKQLLLDPEKLEFESDIGHTNNLGTRLVDLPEHRNNFELWEDLLRFRQRHYGENGTQVIWEGITNRVGGVKLPLAGERADFFWQSFIDLGLKREIFLEHVVNYAITLSQENNGQYWPLLYEHVVGGLLERGMDKKAIEWHGKLQASGIASPENFAQVLPYIISPPILAHNTDMLLLAGVRPTLRAKLAPLRLKTLKELCRNTDHQVYGLVVEKLLEQGHGEHALAMHDWLVARQDHPKSLKELDSLLEYTRDYGLRREYDNLRQYSQRRFSSSFRAEDMSHEMLEGKESGQQNTKVDFSGKRQYKDDIAARLFATRALNLDMVIGGLRILGVSKIGPRTLREMAVRVQDSQEMLANLKSLRKSGISLADSVFTRLVPKLAAQNREFLLSDLLQSDQHPDVLEDAKLQESLLVSYYMARDWRQYNVSLAILAEHYPDSPDLFDIHFRKHLAAGELNAASKVVDELTLHGKTLSEDSVDFMAEKLLPNRRMHHKPQQTPGQYEREALMFVFKVLKRVVPTGCYVSAAFWEELLKRWGMGNYWNELRECSLWLARQYIQRPEETEKLRGIFPSQRTSPVRSDSRMLTLIFSSKMQQAIVAWGFMFRVTRETEKKYAIQHPTTGDKLIPWTRGLLLLRELKQAGLALHTGPIQSMTRVRLNLLFGSYSHSAVRFNRMLRRVNPYSLNRVIADINMAWGESLFEGREYLRSDELVNPSRSARSWRNSVKVVLSRRRAR
ncbi:hypothetical protein N7456_009192 [Penicillium angulare]|uniref:Pentatricopeptide repeat domain-containing protein n=1 Tax=Penicillium angulare TaxID=116970 RepID=A0A9W9K5H7_9EURO|nr:hypothetical protein N7456_009192 [Penicillium angulare]